MDTNLLFTILAGVLLVVGFIGTFVPMIPGVPLAWVGLLLSYFSEYNQITILCLIITAVIAVIISILDNIFPVFMTKKTGGSKYAVIGSTVGLIAGFFIAPISIMVGAFLGAFIGELIHSDGNVGNSIKAAFGAFLGFILSTGIKMIIVAVYVMIFVFSFIMRMNH